MQVGEAPAESEVGKAAPVIIGSAVLQGEEEYLGLLDQIETLKSINWGLQDYLDGKIHTHSVMKNHFRRYVQKRKK